MFTLANLLIQQIFKYLSCGRNVRGIINEMLQTVFLDTFPLLSSLSHHGSHLSLSMSLSQQLLSLPLLSNLYSDSVEALNTCTVVETSHNITGHSRCVNR